MRVIEICEPLREGVGRHVTDVALGLSRRGHDVHLIYSPLRVDPALAERVADVRGLTVAQIPMRREPHWSDIRAAAQLRAYLVRNGPFDVIHAHSSKAGVLARLVGMPGTAGVIYTPHAFVTMMESGLSRRERFIYGAIERVFSLLTNRIICGAAAEFDHARERLQLAERRLVVMHNSIDPSTFRFESSLRSEFAIAANRPIIGFVGRLERQKGADVAIRALAAIGAMRPDAILAIIGEGRERDRLERLAVSCNVAHALRWLGPRSAREYYHNFDMLLCPSRYDGGAYTPIEGLYCGLPVIATPVGIVAEVISHRVNGFLVPTEDPDAVAAQAVELLENPVLALQVGAAARLLGDYFLPSRMLDELEEIYFGRLSGWRPLVFQPSRQAT